MEDSVGLPVVNGFQRVELGYLKATNGLLRFLNGRLTGVHKVLCSVAEIACDGRQDFHLGHDGGYMVPIHSKKSSGNEGMERTNSFQPS